jgi:hypothetical protein
MMARIARYQSTRIEKNFEAVERLKRTQSDKYDMYSVPSRFRCGDAEPPFSGSKKSITRNYNPTRVLKITHKILIFFGPEDYRLAPCLTAPAGPGRRRARRRSTAPGPRKSAARPTPVNISPVRVTHVARGRVLIACDRDPIRVGASRGPNLEGTLWLTQPVRGLRPHPGGRALRAGSYESHPSPRRAGTCRPVTVGFESSTRARPAGGRRFRTAHGLTSGQPAGVGGAGLGRGRAGTPLRESGRLVLGGGEWESTAARGRGQAAGRRRR